MDWLLWIEASSLTVQPGDISDDSGPNGLFIATRRCDLMAG